MQGAKARARPFLIGLHHSGITDNICSQYGGKSALNAFIGH
ncbi:MAG: hypothetical protein O7B98_10505 [Alphaproteobacteria bacterium]|nr:hypothetical protein [Alphaproteobacteria bacterium]